MYTHMHTDTHTCQTPIHIHVHTYAYTYMPYTHTFTDTHTYTYTYTPIHITHPYTNIHTPIYIYIHPYTHMHIHTSTRIYTHPRTHIHTHTYTHICTYTYTHTHMHIHTHSLRQRPSLLGSWEMDSAPDSDGLPGQWRAGLDVVRTLPQTPGSALRPTGSGLRGRKPDPDGPGLPACSRWPEKHLEILGELHRPSQCSSLF